MRKPPGRYAFTLVELLVVIGIIALLIGILLPSLQKAREAADAAVCLSTLRQTASAMNAYQASYKGAFTHSFTVLFPVRGNNLGKGHERSFQMRQCPTWAKKATAADPSMITAITNGQSYGLNPWIGGVQTATAPSPWRSGSVKNSAELAVLGDIVATRPTGISYEDATSFNDVYMASQPNFAANKLARPTFQGRHNGRGSVLWLDGHATLETPTSPTSAANFSGDAAVQPPAYYIANRIGFLVPPTAALASPAAMYYFVARKDLTAPGVTSAMIFRAKLINGNVFIVPKVEHW